MFINRNDQVEQIYLSRKFKGSVGTKQPFRGIQLSDVEREFGAHTEVDKLNYQPPPAFRPRPPQKQRSNRSHGQGKGRISASIPREQKALIIFYNSGKVMKYKYVLDEEGIAFWLDHNKQLTQRSSTHPASKMPLSICRLQRESRLRQKSRLQRPRKKSVCRSFILILTSTMSRRFTFRSWMSTSPI